MTNGDIISDVFNETQPGTPEQAHFKKEIWSYELVHVLVLVLKQNFELIPGRWKVATELATFARSVRFLQYILSYQNT